jgi:hypothetical protein
VDHPHVAEGAVIRAGAAGEQGQGGTIPQTEDTRARVHVAVDVYEVAGRIGDTIEVLNEMCLGIAYDIALVSKEQSIDIAKRWRPV